MKKFIAIGFVLIFITFLFGCGAKPANQGPTPAGTDNQNTAVTDIPGSGSSGSMTNTDSQNMITVSGRSERLSLHSADFIDGNTGWVIGDDYNSSQANSRIMSTYDGGVHWEEIPFDNMTADKLMFVDKSNGWLIAHTVDGKTADGNETYTMKILSTVDGGKSFTLQWQQSSLESNAGELWFQDKLEGYALINGILLSTRDGGRQWTKVTTGIDGFSPEHMDFINKDTGWIIGIVGSKDSQNSGTRLLVLKTKDGGVSWQRQFDKKYNEGPIGSVDIDFTDASNGWFLTSDMASWNGELYYTSDSGNSWKKVNDIKCVRPTPTQLDFINASTGWIPLDVGAGPIEGGILVTHDGGKSFDTVRNGVMISSAHEVDFISPQQGWAVAESMNYGDFLVRTTDGGKSWIDVYPKVLPIKDITFADNLHGFGLGKLSDPDALLSTDNGGKSWSTVKSFAPTYNINKISFTDMNTGWVMGSKVDTGEMVVFKTSDGGINWTSIPVDDQNSPGLFPVYFKFFNSLSGIIIYDSGDSILYCRTDDGGKTWQSEKQSRQKGIDYQYFFMSDSLGWKNELSYDGKTVDISMTDGGAAWNHMGRVGSNISSYGMDFISKDKGWMLVQEPPFEQDSKVKLLTTSDGGHTWASKSFPDGFMLDYYDNQLEIQFTDERHGWILAVQGLLSTQDGGNSWVWQ